MTDNQNMNKTIDNLVPTRSDFVLETKLIFLLFHWLHISIAKTMFANSDVSYRTL